MGDAVRAVWLVMTVLCCIWAGVACLAGDATGALTLSGSGIVFWFMSLRHFDDFDAL